MKEKYSQYDSIKKQNEEYKIFMEMVKKKQKPIENIKCSKKRRLVN